MMNILPKKVMSNQTFTKQKFLKLDTKKQHKKLSEILREIYEKLLLKQYTEHLFNHYFQICNWIGIDLIDTKDLKEISDRYHFHLKKADVSLKEHNLLPALRSIDGKNIEKPFLENAIYLDHLRSAFNVGNIIRTCEALRIGKIYFDDKTPYIENEKVQKTSMGSYQLTKCINKFKLKDLPRPFIGLDTSNKSISIHEFIFPEKFTLILGNEEYGISNKMLKEIDYLIEIPMLGFKNSINVASAFAICSNEIRRQKLLTIQRKK
ncbi:MAG: putative TrmH family tRNA/rRNA methyltransferase [Candidatus Anoxychlamydiales bacterium]|nr:putative TrmH family tRNA/rRNA methyltransferase [Candidatus Anoxychlamydiales bacterium]